MCHKTLSTYSATRCICRLSGAGRHRQGRRSPEVAAQARTHGLRPAALQPYVALFRRNSPRLHPRNYMDYYSFTNPGERGG